jgi:hypothetical protein
MSKDLFSVLLDEVGAILKPLQQALEDPQALDSLLEHLSTDTKSVGNADLLDGLRAVSRAMQHIEELCAAPSLSLAGMGTGLDALGEVLAAARALGSAGPGTYPELGADLVELLTMSYLQYRSPLAFQIAVMLGLVQIKALPLRFVEGTLSRMPAPVLGFNFEQLQGLLTDPVATLRAPFPSPPLATVAGANQTADLIVERIGGVLTALGVPWLYGFPPEEAMYFEDAAPFMDHALLIYAPESLVGKSVAGVCLALSSTDRDDLGLVVTPFGGLNIQRQVSGWDFELALTAEVQAFAVGGGRGFQLLVDTNTAQVQVLLKAIRPQFEEGPAFVIGAPDGTRLEVGGAQITAETSLSEARQSLALSADVSSSAIVIAPGDGDGFLRSILPAEGLQAKFDLGLAWSNERGLTFRGSGSLDATLPVGISIGGVLTVPTIHLSLQAGETGLTAEISASVGVSIGPVHTIVDRVGIAAAVTFPEAGGNVGVADLDLHFKPPTGLGLAIDAPVVVGGGYLRFDPQKEEYSGMLELQIAERIAVKGIGLLTTRMPDGGTGYSLVVIIFAEGFAPIQLGFGFTLTGIGGLLAINRTFAEEALRAGLKNHTLDSVMFPTDPIRNAPQILSNLNSVFPPANGHHLFGPMAQIAWGTPPLITADLGVVLEFGARLRLLILAQVVVILPRRENDLLRLQMDAIGVVDFDQGTAALDATLYDSRLLKKFVLTGDMAMRLQWEASPNFALAIGGLHPAFNPPPNFPKLERIAINLSAGDNPRIRCEAYFALTANTVQFGARAELYAAASGFSIQGEIGFDVLIQLEPFIFLADFYAQVQLKRGSTSLFKVRVEGVLEGPRPLHIKGKATFEILWWDVAIRIDTTLVEGETPPLPEPVVVLPLLREALSHPGNWRSQLPAGQRPMVTLRATSGAATEVCLHPLGTLTVKQSVVPLNLEISRFGSAVPAGARRFTISPVSLGGQNPTTQALTDFFAPAQFFEMSDDEKLSRPSFEPMAAGLSLGSDKFVFTDNPNDWLEVEAIAFDTIIVDKQTNRPRPSDSTNLYTLSPKLLGKQARFGAAGTSDLRRTGKAKYRTTMGKYRMAKEGWSIVATDDLTVQPVPGIEAGRPASYSEAAQALRKLQQENPAKAAGLKILRPSEVRAID